MLGYNKFEGPIPAWLWNLPKVQILDVSNNNFTGAFASDTNFTSMQGFINTSVSPVPHNCHDLANYYTQAWPPENKIFCFISHSKCILISLVLHFFSPNVSLRIWVQDLSFLLSLPTLKTLKTIQIISKLETGKWNTMDLFRFPVHPARRTSASTSRTGTKP